MMAVRMRMLYLIVMIFIPIWIGLANGANTIRYASGCSVDLCTLKNATANNGTNTTSSCPNLPVCYLFDTSRNTSLCAPQVICSLFDPCTSTRSCTSNTSVCVINTCCTAPICMPLSLTASCSMYTPNNTRDTWSGTICPNATWAANSTIFINGQLNSTYWSSMGDFVIDGSNNLYVLDINGYRVLKYAISNPSVFTVAAITSTTTSYYPSALSIDTNGSIYTAEAWYQSSGATYIYRIVKYNQNGVTSGTTVYGPTTCGTATSEMCFCSSLFVDRTGAIYYCDSSNHRVLRMTSFASSATVVAGTSGISGASLNQLFNPSGIYVDTTGALFVADQNNYRVIKFASGSLFGTVLYTLASFQAPIGIMMDNGGNIYSGTYSGIFRYASTSGAISQVVSQVFWGVTRVRFDNHGNMYTGGYSSSNIYKYNITTNNC